MRVREKPGSQAGSLGAGIERQLGLTVRSPLAPRTAPPPVSAGSGTRSQGLHAPSGSAHEPAGTTLNLHLRQFPRLQARPLRTNAEPLDRRLRQTNVQRPTTHARNVAPSNRAAEKSNSTRLTPAVLRCPDDANQYVLEGRNHWQHDLPYPPELPADGPLNLHHDADAYVDRALRRAGRLWDLFAVSSALRDRYFLGAVTDALNQRDALSA